MPLTGTGAGLALADNGKGKLTFAWGADGNPKFDDSQVETVMSLLLESPWFGDRAKKRRTLIPTVKTKDASTPGRLAQYARDALQPAIDDGRIKSMAPTVEPSGIGYSLRVSYVTGTGKQASVNLPLSV